MTSPTTSDRDIATERLVQDVNQRTGSDLRYVKTADLGETGGAAFVMWPDGRQSVVTVATAPLAAMCQAAEILGMARARGLAVPCQELVVALEGEVVAVVQERLPGVHATIVDAVLIDTLVDSNDRFADLLADREDVAVPPLYLASGGAALPWHETLEHYSDRSRRVLRRIEAVGSSSPNEMSGNDLVHPDFTVPNVLFDGGGQITGIVDWNNGVFRGDRTFALVKLLFDLTWDGSAAGGGRHHIQPSALARLETVLHESTDADALRRYWAHWTLTMLHWTIRSGDTDVIDLHLRLGERGLE